MQNCSVKNCFLSVPGGGDLPTFNFNFPLNTGSVCLPGVRLPCRASLRWRRRVHPGILRILRQPHLQVDRLIGRSIADFIFSEKFYDVQKIHPPPPFSGHMALERGVWDQKGLATTPWSPVLTLSMGVITTQAESNLKFVYCNL